MFLAQITNNKLNNSHISLHINEKKEGGRGRGGGGGGGGWGGGGLRVCL